MGLGTVELVIEVEDRFGIRIPDEDAERLITAGGIAEYVFELLPRLGQGTCRSATVFYKLRTALVQSFQIDSHRVQLNTPMNELLRGCRPHRAWKQLQESLEFQLPPLWGPGWLRVDIYGSLFAVLVCSALAWNTWDATAAFVVCVSLSITLLAMLIVLSNRLATIPASCRTVRGLVETVVARIPAEASMEPAAVWDTVREIISDQCGVPIESVTRDSRLVDDLGLG